MLNHDRTGIARAVAKKESKRKASAETNISTQKANNGEQHRHHGEQHKGEGCCRKQEEK